MKSIRNKLPIIIILLIAAFLRLYNLSGIIISLNTDELAIGYNSYSLLTTGKDEWGKTFPLSLQSFGDWKLPLYPLITMVPIKIFGLNEFAVRITSALAGIASVGLIYLLSLKIFRKKPIALMSAVFLAISPWSILFSRGAYEPNLALAFLLAGIYLFYYFIEKDKFYSFLFSAIFFALTIFTYASYDVFMPLFFATLLIFYRRKIFNQKVNFIPVIFFFIVFGVFIFSTLSGSIGKLTELSIYNDPGTIYNRSDRFRSDASHDSLIIEKLIYNKYTAAAYQLGENYLESFSQTFLFDKGGVKVFYNISGFGFLYLSDSFLLVLGLFFLIWKKHDSLRLIIIWLLIAPIPLAITKEVPAPTRIMAILPVFMFIEAYGAYTFYEYAITKKMYLYKLVGITFLFVFLYNFIFFIDIYFKHLNVQNAIFFHYGYKQAVLISNKYPNDKIVMTGPDNFPYISFLFYDKYDPNKFRQEVKYYPQRINGLVLVKNFGRFTFETINRKKLQKNTLYIDNATLQDTTNLIKLPNGDPLFAYFEGK